MKKLIVAWLAFSVAFIVHHEARATHFAGGDFNYECIGQDSFRVTFNWYRDCSGVNAPGSINIQFSSNCSTFTQTLPFVQEIEVSQLCPSFIANSTCNGGAFPGLVQRLYLDTIVIPQCNTSLWTMSYGFNNTVCCRNVSENLITNGPNNGPRFRVDATLRNDNLVGTCNNAPVFNSQPIPFVCVNQTVDYNFGVTDPDGDSLVYSIINPKPQVAAPPTADASYFPDPPYNPTTPLGIASVLDPLTGQFTFTPTATMVGNWTVAVQVCEFRNGIQIGCVTRDIQFVVENCANQTPNAPNSFTNFVGWADSTNQTTVTAYPGQDFCIDITFDDPNAGDTLTLVSNVQTVLPGATVTFTGFNPATARVCWTATTGVPVNNVFIVTANDSACPVSASNSFAVNVIVPPCTQLVGVFRQTEVTCAGACDGTVRVRMFCGTGPYTYSWNPAPAQIFGAGDSVRLCGSAVAYNLLVTDQTTNETWSTSIAALDPPPINTSFTITHNDCDPGTCVGQIQVNASGGTGTLSYNWSNGPNTPTNTGLCAGLYTLTITDQNNCSDSSTYEVLDPIPVTASILSTTDVTCNGGNDGAATADGSFAGCGVGAVSCTGPTELDTVGSGTGTNTASTFPAAYGTHAASARHQFLFLASELQAAGLSAGQITSLALDVATVGNNPSLSSLQIRMGCTSASNLAAAWESGLVTVMNPTSHFVSAGWNEHTFDNSYVWDGTSNLVVEICFDNGFNINNGNSLTRHTTTSFISARYYTTNSMSACNAGASLTAISPNRANMRFRSCSASVSYAWSPPPASGTNASVSNLTAGTYIVTVSSPSGCTDTAHAIISEPPAINVTVNLDQAISCGGVCDAAITASATGGDGGPYTFTWDNGLPNGASQGALCPGTYNVTATDANGCTGTGNIIITNPTPVAVSINLDQPISCNGVCDGEVTASASGGDGGPYIYTWDNGLPNGANQTGLCAGTYNVTATDGSGCTATGNIVISEPALLTLSTSIVQGISCNGVCDGEISAVAAGGTMPYTYTWDNGLPNGGNQTAVCAGTYNVTVTDANNCTATGNVVLTEPTAITTGHTITQPISCNGVCDGAVTVNASGGSVAIDYTYSWPGGLTGASQSNLCAGTYLVTVTDDSNCTVVETVTLTEPAAIAVTINLDQAISCNGVCDGEVTASATGGDGGPYIFTWDNGLPNGANQTGLCAGTYNVTVTDGSGCTGTNSITVTEPAAMTASINLDQPISCNGVCDGEVTASATGGDGGPYIFTWDNGLPNGANQTGLCAGTYNVTATDGSGCTATSNIVITEPTLLTLSTSIDQAISCNGICNGEISAAATGGTVPYTYTWDNGLPNGGTQTNVCAGTYNVTVTDGNNCTATGTVVLNEPTAIVTSNTIIQPISCNGVCDGEVTVSATGGTPPYSYAWPGGLTGANQSGLCANTYLVTVTDDSNCTAVDTVVLTEPAAIVVSIAIDQPVTCGGSSTGQITASATGGDGGPYIFMWDNGLGMGATQGGLSAGTYNVTATDGSGCTGTGQIILTDPSNLQVIIDTIQPISCNGVCDGSLEAVVTGGTTPYTYAWSNTDITDTIVGLCANTYTVTITDANGCTTTATTTLTEPTLLTLATNIDRGISCNGVCDGEISAAATGGTAPYTYTWDNGLPNGGTQTNVCAGTYNVTVTDGNNCTATGTVVLNEPTAIVTSNTIIQPISCNGVCDGEVTVSATGGTPPYSYAWPGGLTGANQSGLCANTYLVTVTDDSNCTAVDTVVLTEPAAIVVSIAIDQPVTCGGSSTGQITASATGGDGGPYIFMWDNGLGMGATQGGLSAGTYNVTATDGSGCTGTGQIILTDPSNLQVIIDTIQPISCNGVCDGSLEAVVTGGTTPYTYAWSNTDITDTIVGLCANTYTVTITDANGCTTTATTTLTEPTLLTLATNIDRGISCNGVCDGEISAVAAGGTAPYTYTWDNGLPNGGNQTNVCAGTYNVTVTDGNNCTATGTVILNEPTAIVTSNTIIQPISCNGVCDGEVTVSATGGTPPYSYAWPGGLAGPNQSGLCANTYLVTVTDDSNCTAVDTVVLTEPGPINATINLINGVSCNGVCDATIEAVITGGTAPFTYSWNGGGPNNDTLFNVCGGLQTLNITDANGCTTSASLFVTDPAAIVLVAGPVVPVSCNGVCDGTAIALAFGGTGVPTFAWSNGDTGPLADSLCPGTVIVTVTDANGCTDTAQVIMASGAPFTAAITTSSNISCFGAADGSATVSLTPPSTGVTYAWSPAPAAGQVTPTVTGLTAGTYVVTVTDTATGCFDTAGVTITEPAQILINTTITQPISCNGVCDGAATASANGGTAPYTYDWPGGLSGASQSGLCAGTYVITVTDASLCTETDTLVLTEPGPVSFTQVVTTASCNGVCDGEAQLTPQGGTAPHTFNWPGGITGSFRNNLCAGTYTVTIVDANGCTGTDIVNITEPAVLVLGLTLDNNPTCASTCDGQVTASATGGTAPFIYSWPGGLTGPVQSALCAGTYIVTVTDLNNCTDTAQITLVAPPGLTMTLNATSTILCNGSCTGSIEATVSGGSTPYTYNWSVPAPNQNTISNLCAGMYTVTVTDQNGCSIIDSLALTEPPAIVLTPAVTNATCGVCDGSIDLTNVTGGTGAYTYTWGGITPNPGNVNTVGSLCPGTYPVTVTDANGCDATLIIPVSSNGGATSATFNTTFPSCNGLCDGSSTVTPTGGLLPYDYQWSTGLIGDTLASVSNLCAGIYFVTITDAAGCVFIASDTLLEPIAIQNTITVTPISCFGNCDGGIAIVSQFGASPYSYLWNDTDTNRTRTNLCPGQYIVTTTDANGCERFDTVNLIDPPALGVSFSITDASCFNTCDGVAQATGLGGTAPYMFQWSSGSVSDTAQALCPGDVFVTVTDANGCTFVDTATIGSPPAIVIDNIQITEPTCTLSDGSIELFVSGGTGGYQYVWNGGALLGNPLTGLPAGGYTVTITDGSGCEITTVIPLSNQGGPALTTTSTPASCNGACTGTASVTAAGAGPYDYQWSSDPDDTLSTVSGLCAGIYIVTVTDPVTLCSSVDTVQITQPAGLNLNLIVQNNSNCSPTPVCVGEITASASGGTAPFTYQWSNSPVTDSTLTSLCAGTYTVTVTSAEGCVAIDSAQVLDAPPLTGQVDAVGDATCSNSNDGFVNITLNDGVPPFTIAWIGPGFVSNQEDISNLLPGQYTVSVIDQAGCTYFDTVDVGVLTNLTLTLSDTVVCDPVDSINLVASGTSNFPITYTWFNASGLPLDTGRRVTVPYPGGDLTSYSVVATANGCVVTDTLRVSGGLVSQIDAGDDTTIVLGESATIGGNPTSNIGGSVYQWTPTDGLNDPNGANPTARPQATTTYTVLVQNVGGCTGTDSVTVTVNPRFEYPTGFSPNGDGVNEAWQLDFLGRYPDCTVQIFNRWGQLLFESEGYREPWDGTYEGQDLPIGTYYYVIDLGREDVTEPLTGPVTIMR